MNQHFVAAFWCHHLLTLTELEDAIQHTITIIPIGRVLNGIRTFECHFIKNL